MTPRKLLDLGTDAITDGSQEAFSLSAADFAGNSRPIVVIKGLAGVETCSLWIAAGDDWEEVDDGSGTQETFTATAAHQLFNGAAQYGLTKDATAGALEVWLHTGR